MTILSDAQEAIKLWNPEPFGKERGYHLSLEAFLKVKFPNAKIEREYRHSRLVHVRNEFRVTTRHVALQADAEQAVDDEALLAQWRKLRTHRAARIAPRIQRSGRVG